MNLSSMLDSIADLEFRIAVDFTASEVQLAGSRGWRHDRQLARRARISISANGFGLDADELLEPDQFQQREKSADDFGPVRGALKQFGEAHAAALGDDFQDELDFFADGPFVLENVARVAFALFEALQHAVDGVEQVENATRPVSRAGAADSNSSLPGRRGKTFSWRASSDLQLRGGVLEFFIFDELADEFPARVFAFVLAFDDAPAGPRAAVRGF